MPDIHWWCYCRYLDIRRIINLIIWINMRKKIDYIIRKFDEWTAIWIVFGLLASAVSFQTYYILHLKSQLKLFQNDEKTSTNSVSDSISIQTRRR